MNITTRTTIFSYLDDRAEDIEVRVDHEKGDEVPIGVHVGCIDEWFTEDDLRKIVKMLNKALLLRKRGPP